MTKEPAGPTAVGTQRHESIRLVPGLWLHVNSVVTEVRQPRRLGMDFRSSWLTGHLTYDIEPADGGSVLRQREELRPRRLPRRFTGVIEERLRARLRERLDDIKGTLDGQPGPMP